MSNDCKNTDEEGKKNRYDLIIKKNIFHTGEDTEEDSDD